MEENLANKIGAAARAARIRRGWSQADAAEQIGISVEFYARMERGRTMPSVPTLVAMASALQVSADEIIGKTAGSSRRTTGAAAATTESKDLRLLVRRLRTASPKTVRLLNLLAAALEK
jgi:transcriptional regulator with XRE-family HTH domain